MLRKQSWRDFLTAAKADPIVRELRDAGIKPKDLDGAFETVCLYEEVEFPPGDAVRPDTAAGFKALDTFWAAMCRKLPKDDRAGRDLSDAEEGARVLRADAHREIASGQARHPRGAARDVGFRAEDHAEVLGRRRRGEEEDRRGDHDAAHRVSDRRHPAIPCGLAAVHLPAEHHAAHDRARARRARAAARQHPQLRRPAATRGSGAARQRGGPPGASREVPMAVRGRIPGHRSRPGRDHLSARG